MQDRPLTVQVTPFGPDTSTLRELSRAVLQQVEVQEHLRGTEHRLLSLDLVDSENKMVRSAATPTQYRATVYDYTNDRTLVVNGHLDNRGEVEVTEYARQPLPTQEEFTAAVRVLTQDEQVGPALRDQQMVAYKPMPPTITTELPDGRLERVIAVGLRASNNQGAHHIHGVNLGRGEVLHEPYGVPAPQDVTCGPPENDDCSSSGDAKMARVEVTQGNRVLWTFTVVRPAASTGTNGSGIELRNVSYRNKSVLYRAHVPILNVKYDADGVSAGCGPTYRDWQNQENCFQATGSDPVPGFRLCTSPATTILDTGTDAGNFRGVAIYVDGLEVVLVSEMSAGWYRYISMWRLHADGTIRPRFGFAATDNPCTCHPHHHHCYWRLDFDISAPTPNLVEEFNDPPIIPGTNWHKKLYEIRRQKDPAHKRKWRVTNPSTGAGYTIVPGPNDGTADSYGVGDLWVLRYHGSTPPPTGEVDDGQGFTTSEAASMAHLDNFKNGEVVENQDVVIWYAAHFFHDEHYGGGGGHIVGPDLIPFNW